MRARRSAVFVFWGSPSKTEAGRGACSSIGLFAFCGERFACWLPFEGAFLVSGILVNDFVSWGHLKETEVRSFKRGKYK